MAVRPFRQPDAQEMSSWPNDLLAMDCSVVRPLTLKSVRKSRTDLCFAPPAAGTVKKVPHLPESIPKFKAETLNQELLVLFEKFAKVCHVCI